MSSAPGPQGCPGSDDLSAAVDGLAPEEIAVHIESCSRCQRHVEALRRIDVAVRRRMTPPEGLSARIRQAVKDGAARETTEMPRWWMSPVLRLAAAVAVTAAAIGVLVNVLGDRSASKVTVAEKATPVPATVAVQDTPKPVPTPGALVDANALRLARAGGGGVPGDAAGGELPQGLPRMVRHVWTVADTSGEIGHLKGLLPKGSYDVGSEDGNTVFTVVLPDRDLQKLVDALAARRWQLVSPDMPQPQKQSRLVLTGQDVRYSLVMVQQP